MAEYVVDEYGKWELKPYEKILCEPSELWLHEHALPEPTQAEKRESAYRTLINKQDNYPLLKWEEKAITVDEANALWNKYAAEDSLKAAELTKLITTAKEYIRSLYPDTEK